jgi:mannose-6-phosphate isomerase-like protein (cupin superfamily)
MTNVIRKGAGIAFQADDDRARLIVSGSDTDGRYSLLEWTVAAGSRLNDSEPRDFGPHIHRECEEGFLIRSGSLEFLIGAEVVTLEAGDYVRVPPGVVHGYANTSGKPVEMLVSFYPGGFEELFLKYRNDQPEIKGAGFIADATSLHGSEFGLPNPPGVQGKSAD